jgi:translocator protein
MYSEDWYKNIKKSPLSPPSWLFGVVWPILYCMIFASLILVVKDFKNNRIFKYSLIMFFLQLIFNLIWTTIFFKFKKYKLALVDLYLTIIFTGLTIYYFYKLNKISAYLLIPYFLWICFASYLNLYIVLNN